MLDLFIARDRVLVDFYEFALVMEVSPDIWGSQFWQLLTTVLPIGQGYLAHESARNGGHQRLPPGAI